MSETGKAPHPTPQPEMGPNVRRLVVLNMEAVVIASGDDPDEGEHMVIFEDPAKFLARMRQAQAHVAAMIEMVKATPGNPYGDDDERIAGWLLGQREGRMQR